MAQPEVVGTTEAELARRPSLRGWAPYGFCEELREVTGGTVNSFNGVPNSLGCFTGYGVDGVSFFGEVSAGYPWGDLSGTRVSSPVNGHQVGVMDAVISGAAAKRIFQAMQRTFSGALTATQVQSRSGGLFCEDLGNGYFECRVHSMSGFSTP